MDAYSAPPVKPADYDGSQPLDPAYFGEVEEFVHYNLSHDNPVRGGGRAAAARALVDAGEVVATRAEFLAGTTGEEVQDRWSARLHQLRDHVAAEQERAKTIERRAAEQRAARGGAEGPGSLVHDLEQDAIREAQFDARQAAALLAKHEHGQSDEVRADQRRLADGYISALSEIRDMGGGEFTIVKGARRQAVSMAAEAAEIFPDEWVQASNDSERPLQVRLSKGARASFNHSAIVDAGFVPMFDIDRSGEPKSGEDLISTDPAFGDWREDTNPMTGDPLHLRAQYEVADANTKRKKDGTPAGPDWEEWRHPHDENVVHHRRLRRTDIKGREWRAVVTLPSPSHHTAASFMEGRDYGTSTAMHELTHRMERSVPLMRNAEHAYLATRTDVSKTVRIPGHPPGEVHYPGGGFVTPYVAKAYGATGEDGYPPAEVMSMGVESMFSGTFGGLVGTGKNRSDPDHRGFVLGVMAVLGRPR